MDGLENFAGYLVSKLGLQNYGFRTSQQCDQNYTYVNLQSEGGLYKPTTDFLAKIEELNNIFIKINGDSLDTNPNYMKKLLSNTNSMLEEKVVKRFFLGRTFFRIRFLNRNKNQFKANFANKKMKKTIT